MIEVSKSEFALACLAILAAFAFTAFVCWWCGFDSGKIEGNAEAWSDIGRELERRDIELTAYATRVCKAENVVQQIAAIIHPPTDSIEDVDEEEVEDDS